VWNAVVLHHRAGLPDGAPSRPAVPDRAARLARVVVALAAVVVTTGTIVTAAGPHAGDEQAERLDLALPDVTRVHGLAVLALVAAVLLYRRLVSTGPSSAAARDGGRLLLLVLLAQAAVGYTQYFTGVPALLVGVHVCGALAVWIAATRLPLLSSEPVEREAPAVALGAVG
jgi:cytochrome c oxidase assembly protein subunit 15